MRPRFPLAHTASTLMAAEAWGEAPGRLRKPLIGDRFFRFGIVCAARQPGRVASDRRSLFEVGPDAPYDETAH